MTEPLFDLPEPRKPIHACTGMNCPICHAHAVQDRDRAMGLADDHADEDWRATARAVIRDLAWVGEFTTDDVWVALSERGKSTREPRALGPVVMRLIREGLIHRVGYAPSRRRHASPIPVYRSGAA